MLNRFNKRVKPEMFYMVESQIDKYSKDIIMKSFNKKLLENHNLNNVIKIRKNKNDEIIAVDFDLDKAYAVSLDFSQNIKESLPLISNQLVQDTELIKPFKNNNFIILLPLGLASQNSFLANLGPKIPVKIYYEDSLVTGLKTKVSNYGINNALLEIYLNVTLSENVYIPFSKKKLNTNFKILLSSLVVEGTVPDLYNGLLENNSSLINVPLN